MAAMVNKFADEEEEAEPADDDSSFEEIPKPVERPARTPGTESPKPDLWKQKPAEKPRPAVTEASVPVLTVEYQYLMNPLDYPKP